MLFLAAAGSHGARYRDIFIDGFVPPPNCAAPMFPFYENASEWDDFGEVINPDDYIIKDDDMDQGALPVSILSQFAASMLASLTALGTIGLSPLNIMSIH